MRLLIVTPWPLASAGGGQRLAREVAWTLARHDAIDVVVAAGSGAPPDPAPPLHADGFHEVRLPLAPARGDWKWRRAPFGDYCLEGLEEVTADVQADAILYISHYSRCAVQAASAARNRGVVFLLWPAIHLDVRVHISPLARRFYRSADMVLCLSEPERQWLVRCAGVAPDRSTVIDYGWTGQRIEPPTTRKATAAVSFLSVGAYVPHKQFDHQLEVIGALRAHGVDARLTIVGVHRDPAVFSALARAVRDRGLNGCVDLRINGTEDEIDALYAAASFFLFTSRSESFGIALFDAIRRGTWPIIYPHAVYRQQVDESGFGIVAERMTPPALKNAMLQALSSDPTRRDDARRRWLDDRVWSRTLRPLVEVLSAGRTARTIESAGAALARSGTPHAISELRASLQPRR